MPRRQFLRLQAVIDSSCLQCLLLLDFAFPGLAIARGLQLHYETIHIPDHVWNEVGRRSRRRFQLRKFVRNHPFFKRCSITNPHDSKLLYDRRTNPEARIHRGEAEAIIQARERGLTEILIDERRGTSIAKAHSLNPRGVLGLIKELKLLGIIEEPRPLVEECRRHGFWLNDELVASALKEMEEDA